MVSLWPWGSTAAPSPASFEKKLSALSVKLATTQTRLEKMRSSSRRVCMLWTLYTTFAYIIYAVVLVLAVGYKNIGISEWTGLVSGPFVIYAVRSVLAAIFNYRIRGLSKKLESQQKERADTIQNLKDATKYESTLELLEKYGDAEDMLKAREEHADDCPPNSLRPSMRARISSPHMNDSPQRRTNLPPPPTANIQRPGRPETPRQAYSVPPARISPTRSAEPSSEFAPNAFGPDEAPPRPLSDNMLSMHVAPTERHWYDRILDVLLGEDETAIKNRIALICVKCRLVNGQAPPGTTSLAQVGQWRCMGCATLNGEVDEGERIVREILGPKMVPDGRGSNGVSRSDDDQTEDDSPDMVESTGQYVQQSMTNNSQSQSRSLRTRKKSGRK